MSDSEHRREQDVRLTFDRVPELYDRARPAYPDWLLDQLFGRLPPRPRILEVGPGTGQATVGLLERGADVIAVEIGPALASAMRQKFAGDGRLRVVNASFEDAELELASFDVVVCATAYHWIEPKAQVERPIQLLKPGGALAVIDLIQVDSAVDRGYFERVQPIYEAFGKAQSRWDPKTYESAQPKIAAHLRASGCYDSVEVQRVPWDQTYTAIQYRDLLMSYSGTQMMTEPERTSMVEQLVEVIDSEFGGQLTRPLVATLTTATPVVAG